MQFALGCGGGCPTSLSIGCASPYFSLGSAEIWEMAASPVSWTMVLYLTTHGNHLRYLEEGSDLVGLGCDGQQEGLSSPSAIKVEDNSSWALRVSICSISQACFMNLSHNSSLSHTSLRAQWIRSLHIHDKEGLCSSCFFDLCFNRLAGKIRTICSLVVPELLPTNVHIISKDVILSCALGQCAPWFHLLDHFFSPVWLDYSKILIFLLYPKTNTLEFPLWCSRNESN